MRAMAGATTLGDLASAIGVRTQEAAIVADLKAGSEEAYAWLIGEFHQPVYGLIYRIVNDPSDAADTTQDVFLKVFRGMKHFHGESSLKTWIYRIALHEAANRRRWWFRHKARETSMEPPGGETADQDGGAAGAGGERRHEVARLTRHHCGHRHGSSLLSLARSRGRTDHDGHDLRPGLASSAGVGSRRGASLAMPGFWGWLPLPDPGAPPELIRTIAPWIATPAGLMSTKLPPTFRLTCAAASMMTLEPPLRWISCPASRA